MEFNDWLNKKKLMWSPEEWAALQSGHIKQTEEATRVWEDDEAGRPRRIMIILVTAARRSNADNWGRLLDAIAGDNIFTQGCSANGQEPATHYIVNWNMSYSEYTYLEARHAELGPLIRSAIKIYDGQLTTVNEVLSINGLQIIQEAV